MKKLFFVFALLIGSVVSSYAFQQALYAGPPVGYAGTLVNINMNCSYIKLDLSWTTPSGGSGGGSGVAYGGGTLIGEHTFTPGWSAQTYSGGIFSYQYWGDVQMYLSGSNCYGTAILEWMP
ncbi:hypothetical protein [Paraflavitalea pollutisoli]|uniref:hypothetical protein n=1 Tax=Paraflavitalea pollutisoli TaxID=3034143 RepID=UPI0023EB13A6|nr:hypothetical protein [Paraflavitalea sp. H1-2-19X]